MTQIAIHLPCDCLLTHAVAVQLELTFMLPDVSRTRTRTVSVVSCDIINSGGGGCTLSSGALMPTNDSGIIKY